MDGRARLHPRWQAARGGDAGILWRARVRRGWLLRPRHAGVWRGGQGSGAADGERAGGQAIANPAGPIHRATPCCLGCTHDGPMLWRVFPPLKQLLSDRPLPPACCVPRLQRRGTTSAPARRGSRARSGSTSNPWTQLGSHSSVSRVARQQVACDDFSMKYRRRFIQVVASTLA